MKRGCLFLILALAAGTVFGEARWDGIQAACQVLPIGLTKQKIPPRLYPICGTPVVNHRTAIDTIAGL